MKLNLNLIVGKLKQMEIVYSKMEQLYEYPLEFAMLYEGGAFQSRYLYVMQAQELPEHPVFQERCSLLVIGEVPDCYKDAEIELCVLKSSCTLAMVFNAVSRIFQEYQMWDGRLTQVIYEGKDFTQLGEIIFEQFQNPVDLLNVSDRYLFRAYDKNREENREYYELFTENEYPMMEELQIIYSLPEQMETYTFQEPVLLKNPMYKEWYLHANLFVEGRFVGKLFVGDTYQPIEQWQYSLIQYLAEKLKTLVDETATTVMVHSREMETIIKKLAQGQLEYSPAEKVYLERQNWNQYDFYQVVLLECRSKIKGNRQLTAHASYLHHLLVDVFPLIFEERILIVMHGKEREEFEAKKYRLQAFMLAEEYRGGYSDMFSNFSELSIHCKQAEMALELGKTSSGMIYDFSSHVMKSIYRVCLERYDLRFYLTEGLRQLEQYDRKNQTELYRTLRCYLENSMNVSQTLKKLYIHRSTFSYRLERIEKILQCSLSNYKTRLYLQFAMELKEYAQKDEQIST